jgi:hypothetical protein
VLKDRPGGADGKRAKRRIAELGRLLPAKK